MAEAGRLSQQEVGIETFISCSICLETFTRPKLLPCLHAFCAGCLQTYSQKFKVDGQFPCPECRRPTPITVDGVAAFKDYFFMNSLMDFVLGQASSTRCSLCALDGNSVPAEAKCVDCSDYLCQSCTSGHHKTRQTRTHNVVKLDDIKSGRTPQELQAKMTLPCADHPDEHVRYYCATCEKLICRDCQVLGHKNHECKSFDVAARTRRKILDEGLKRLQSVAETERTRMQRQAEMNAELEKIIQSTSNQIIQPVEQITKKTLEELQRKKGDEEVSSDISQLERYGQSLKMLLTRASDVEILDTFQITQNCVQDLSTRKHQPKSRRRGENSNSTVLFHLAKKFKRIMDVLNPLISSSGRLSLVEKILPPAANCGFGLAIDCIGNIYTCGEGKAFVFGLSKNWRDISGEIVYSAQRWDIQFVTADDSRVFFLLGNNIFSGKITIYFPKMKIYEKVDFPIEFGSCAACLAWDDTILIPGKEGTCVLQVSMNGRIIKKYMTKAAFNNLTSIAHSRKGIFLSNYYDADGVKQITFDSGIVDEEVKTSSEESDSSLEGGSDISSYTDEEEDNHSGDVDIHDLLSITCIRIDREDNLYLADEGTDGIYFAKTTGYAEGLTKILGHEDGITKPVELCLTDDQLLVYHQKGIWIYHITH